MDYIQLKGFIKDLDLEWDERPINPTRLSKFHREVSTKSWNGYDDNYDAYGQKPCVFVLYDRNHLRQPVCFSVTLSTFDHNLAVLTKLTYSNDIDYFVIT
jgi:hypothetical protein